MKTYTNEELEAMTLEELQAAAAEPPTDDRPDVVHVRAKMQRRRGRSGYSAAHFARVSGNYPEPTALCGGEITSYDVTELEAKRTAKKGRKIERLCPDCQARVKR